MNILNNLTLMQISSLLGMATSIEIITLAVLLFTILNKQNKIMALVGLGLWLAEAIFLALSQIGASALIPLSQDFVKALAPLHPHYQTGSYVGAISMMTKLDIRLSTLQAAGFDPNANAGE